MARLYMARESPGHTLQTTALVNEAYVHYHLNVAGGFIRQDGLTAAVVGDELPLILIRESAFASFGGELRIQPGIQFLTHLWPVT
jgi:hypothetical protein